VKPKTTLAGLQEIQNYLACCNEQQPHYDEDRARRLASKLLFESADELLHDCRALHAMEDEINQLIGEWRQRAAAADRLGRFSFPEGHAAESNALNDAANELESKLAAALGVQLKEGT